MTTLTPDGFLFARFPESDLGLLLSEIMVGSPDWLLPALLLLVLVGTAVLLGYALVGRNWSAKLGLLLIKLAGVALLVGCLLNPLVTNTRMKPGENIVLLVADDSASLQLDGGVAGSSRGEQIKSMLLNREAEWQVRLGQDFDVRRYIVGERLTPTEDFTPLGFAAPASALLTGLQALQDRFAGHPLAGILLLSDCNATDASLQESLTNWVPIYPVLPDARDQLVDLSVGQTAVTSSAFEDSPVTIQAQALFSGPFPQTIRATLEPLEANESESQTITLIASDAGHPLLFRFQVRPQSNRATVYRLRTALENPEGGTAAPAEVTLVNNEKLIVVDSDRGPYRVLYVSGRPNWEHKFLGRAVAEDSQIDLVSLIRIAKKEAKFDFRGRAGETGNSLFRGFDSEVDAETQAYDQPVLVRLNTRDQNELSGGFPKTKAELYQYQAIILDDIESEFFTHDQLAMIDRFVAERGGGLMMLGGIDTFRQGNWQKTPIRDAIPVYLDRSVPMISSQVQLVLTRDGWLQPWIRLRDTEEKEQERLAEMPGFRIVSPVKNVKPAAQVLCEVRQEEGRNIPAIVAQSYGKGHVAAVLVGDMWRWSLAREEGAEDDLAKAWRQAIRWLVSDVPTRIDTNVEWTSSGQAKAVVLQVQVRSATFEPQDNAAVHVTIQPPEGEPLDLDAEPSLTEPGLFETLYVPRLTGTYRAEIRVDNDQGVLMGATEAAWTSEPLADEFRTTSVNRELAEQLAKQTGGEVISVAGLPEFIASLPHRNVPEKETQTFPLWHTPWLLLIALALLAAEWGLRRVGGLP